jgi:NAD-dependent histone deacetylase SIR2
LRDAGNLVRDYIQNIDCLEEKVGLSTDLQKGLDFARSTSQGISEITT